MRTIQLTAVVILALAQFSRAAIIPIQLDITDGVNAQHLVIDAPRQDFVEGYYGFNVSGETASETWRVEWDFVFQEILVDNPHGVPAVIWFDFSYRVLNLTNDTSQYAITARLPVELRNQPVEYEGQVIPFVTDLNGDGATLTGNPAALSTYYLSVLDGVPFVGLIEADVTREVGANETGGIGTPIGFYRFPCILCGLASGPSIESDIGAQVAFSVTAQDLARVTGSLYVYHVPEPSSFAIGIVLMLLMIASYRVSLGSFRATPTTRN